MRNPSSPAAHENKSAELGSGTAFGDVTSVALCPVRVIEKVSPAVSPARLSATLPEPDVITSGPFGGDAIVEFKSAGLASIECP